MSLLAIMATALIALLAVVTLVLAMEVTASLFGRNTSPALCEPTDRPRLAVLIPAHNESAGIADTIENIKAQLYPHDRLLVVADNCSDATAAIAREAGAEVVVRNDAAHVGKGYALDCGLRFLQAHPPEVVIVIDADCRLAPDSLSHLAIACTAHGHPVQALNLMDAGQNSQLHYAVSVFAFRMKNWARPLGMAALGLPCQMTGTGMALPWNLVGSLGLATGSIVEDLKLGLELVASGSAPVFCPQAVITSSFPNSRSGVEEQRRRWEHGHLDVMTNIIPKMIWQAVRQRKAKLLAAALDAAIPPLTLLGLLITIVLTTTSVCYALGASRVPLLLAASCALAYSLAVTIGWIGYGRDILPLRQFPAIFGYLATKLHLYRDFFSHNRAKQWIRADRKGESRR